MRTRRRGRATGTGGPGLDRPALRVGTGLVAGALLAACSVAVVPEPAPAPVPSAAPAPVPAPRASGPALIPIPALPQKPVPIPKPPPEPLKRALRGPYAKPPAALAAASTARRLYVSPAGSDQNGGSKDAPFRSIGRASRAATPGTTVIVADGTYAGPFTTGASGRPGARITYVAGNKWGAKVVASGGGPIWHNLGNYVDIQGFEISGSAADGIIDAGSHVQILENRVHGQTEGCIATNNDEYTMVDVDIIGNVTFGCGTNQLHHGIYPGGVGGTISNNISYGNAGFGIHCWHACSKQVITNNLVFGNGEGGILIGQGDGPNNGEVPADNMLVANNIVLDNRGSEGIRESGATSSRNRYFNNVMAGNAVGGIGVQTGSASGTINARPRFVDFRPDGSGDYELQQGSAGVDAGTPSGVTDVDIIGNPRRLGGGVDAGPFER